MSSLATMQRWVDESPFGPWWGLRVEAAGEGLGVVRVPYRTELLREGGVLHGGCVAVAADVAMWIAIIASVENGQRALTVNLATDYLAPARSDVVATARLIKTGRRIIVGSVDTHDADGALVAVHRITYALPALR